MNDPWKHRSAGMRCKTCMWFAPKVADYEVADDGDSKPPIYHLGRCRRHALGALHRRSGGEVETP